jgi:hypothetical protein
MSHVADIECEFKDLQAIKLAAEKLGGTFHEGQRTYKWWGRWEGDYPLPEGVKQEDLGKCDHAISFPNAKYEIGIVDNHDGTYRVMWDFWSSGGLQKVVGKDGVEFIRAYEIEKIQLEAYDHGYSVEMTEVEEGEYAGWLAVDLEAYA